MACMSHHRGPAGLLRHGAGAGGRIASLTTAFMLSVLFFAIPAGASDAPGLGVALAAGAAGGFTPLAAGPGEAGLSDVRPVEVPGDARYPVPAPDATAVGNVSGRTAIGPSQRPVSPKCRFCAVSLIYIVDLDAPFCRHRPASARTGKAPWPAG